MSIKLAIVAAVLLMLTATASAESVGVTLGGNYVHANVFDAASRGQTAVQWYNYNQK
jgi:hypothetical protein